MCEYRRVCSSCSRMPHSASCLNPKPVHCAMIFSALLAAYVPALCFHSCKIRFGTRIRSRLRLAAGGGAGRPHNMLSPRMRVSHKGTLQNPFWHADSQPIAAGGGGGGAGRPHNMLSPRMRVSHKGTSTNLYGLVIHACLTPPPCLNLPHSASCLSPQACLLFHDFYCITCSVRSCACVSLLHNPF